MEEKRRMWKRKGITESMKAFQWEEMESLHGRNCSPVTERNVSYDRTEVNNTEIPMKQGAMVVGNGAT